MKYNTYKNVMVDIETLGNIQNSVIVSLGAVQFDIETGKINKTFHEYINIEDSLNRGFQISKTALLWWMQKSRDQRKQFWENEGLPINIILKNFNNYLLDLKGNYRNENKSIIMWSKSPSFDFGILSNAYEKVGMPILWNFRLERCVRTMIDILDDEIIEKYKYKNTHNALEDSVNQVKLVSAAYNKIYK